MAASHYRFFEVSDVPLEPPDIRAFSIEPFRHVWIKTTETHDHRLLNLEDQLMQVAYISDPGIRKYRVHGIGFFGQFDGLYDQVGVVLESSELGVFYFSLWDMYLQRFKQFDRHGSSSLV